MILATNDHDLIEHKPSQLVTNGHDMAKQTEDVVYKLTKLLTTDDMTWLSKQSMWNMPARLHIWHGTKPASCHRVITMTWLNTS